MSKQQETEKEVLMRTAAVNELVEELDNRLASLTLRDDDGELTDDGAIVFRFFDSVLAQMGVSMNQKMTMVLASYGIHPKAGE